MGRAIVVPLSRRRRALILAVLVAAGLAIRLWLLPGRWVNPDEGAHLMDGRLVLDGLLPGVDYSARQPLYVYVLAGWLRLFGLDLFAARVLMVLLDVGVGVLVYLIARRLFDARSGLLAAGIYLLLPFSVVWAPLVHTEPLTAALAALGMYLVVRAVQSGGGGPALVGAGACFALGFYVRQSSLALLLATALVLVVAHRRKPRPILRDGAWVIAGFVAVASLALALYGRRLTAAELWASPVNPLHLVLQSLERIGALPGAAAAGGGSGALEEFRLEIQPWSRTLVYLRQVVSLNSVLLAGFVVFLGWAAVPAARRAPAPDYALPAAVLGGWAGGLALLYAYWVGHRGFYPQYFTEFLSPLAIGLGHVVVLGRDSWRARPGLGRPRDLAAGAVAAACAIWLGAELPARGYVGRAGILATLGFAAAAAVLVRAWRQGRPEAARGAVAATLLGLAGANLAASWRTLGPGYAGPWTPAALRETAAYLRAHAAADDEVMSGAVIWEFAAGLRPFATISHPLGFLGGIDADDRAVIERQLAERPPRFIVLDGYTEQAYVRHVPALAQALGERYEEAAVVSGSRFPIRIYVRRP